MTGRAVPSAAVAGTVVLTVVGGLLAGRADRAAGLTFPAVALDVGVGVVLVGCGLGLAAPALPRALLATAGLAWLAASLVGDLVGAHQAVLVLLLAVVPDARPPRAVTWWLGVAPAVVVAALTVSQPATAVCFAAVALLRRWWTRASWVGVRATSAVAVGAAVLLAVVLLALAGWARTPGYDRTAALEVYQVSLVVVAAALVAATRLTSREATRAAHPAAVGTTGVAELEHVLGSALRRPGLRVLRPAAHGGGLVDSQGAAAEPPTGQALEVRLERRLLAVVTGLPESTDHAVMEAVSDSVRHALRSLEVQQDLSDLLTELERSRGRLLDATDRARAGTATELATRVAPGLREAVSALADARSGSAAVAAAQVEEALDDVRRLTEGVPPDLGDGRLQNRLQELVGQCVVPCALRVDPDARADAVIERTLWLVAAEAVTNALKHSAARGLTVDLNRDDDELVLVVADDGCGGADPDGSGLQGLADRVAASQGRWRVVSVPGSGTTVTARLPVG